MTTTIEVTSLGKTHISINHGQIIFKGDQNGVTGVELDNETILIAADQIREKAEIEQAESGKDKLSCWFSLTYASWLTIPRVMLEAMSPKWQGKLADLLEEYELTFCNQPDIGTRVQVTKDGKLTKTPPWLLNYRHPDFKMLQAMKQIVHKEPKP